ncbi:type II toxin-antitoxin system PemK/MazF family toxin [Acinetobacter sp. CUI P1]|nr:type II toxin-antitoxin system PemK/MazF family toxin [Acinetobacter sp. CUI P1]
MHLNRDKINELKKDSTIKYCLTHINTEVMDELNKISPVLNNHLINSKVEKSSNWMLFKDLWLENESGNLKSRVTYRNYSRGDVILSVDCGTSNIGTEIRYPHPCVVLFDNGEDWVVTVPITAASLDSRQQPIIHEFEVYAAKQMNKPIEEKEYWFRKASVIQVDQVRRVSKYRIINAKDFKLRVELLNQIDNIVLKKYLPKKVELIENMKLIINEKKEENKNLKEQNDLLLSQLEELKKSRG